MTLPAATEQQSIFFHNTAFVSQGARQYLNIMSYGAKVDDTTDDTAAWKLAIADIRTRDSSCVLFVPNTGKASLVTDTLRFYESTTENIWGIVIEGEGSWGAPHQATSTVKWAGTTIRGTSATIGSKTGNTVLLTGLSGLLTAQSGGGVAAQVGDIIEIWGCANDANNVRGCILEIFSDTSCQIWNDRPGAGGETNVSWLLERNLFDLRTSNPHMRHLTLLSLGGSYCASLVTWTQSPLVGSAAPTALTLEYMSLINDNVVVEGQYPVSRWGLKIGSPVVFATGHAQAVMAYGFPVQQSPSNCDLGQYYRCIFQSMEQGGVTWDSTNGNDYAHNFYACAFISMPVGASVRAPFEGQGNFYECGGGNIWDTVFNFNADSLRTTIMGGHSEVCGRIAIGGSMSIDVENHTTFMGSVEADPAKNIVRFGWTSDFGVGHPLGLSPFGDVVSAGADFSVKNCYFDQGQDNPSIFIKAGNPTGPSEVKAVITGNQFHGNNYVNGGGNGIVPFYLIGSRSGPFKLVDGQTVTFTITDGSTGTTGATQTVTFHASDFRDIGRCWPWEVAYAWQKDTGSAGTIPWFAGDGGGIYVLKDGTPALADVITITGGTAAAALGLTTATVSAVLAATAPKSIVDTNGTVYCTGSIHLMTIGNEGRDKNNGDLAYPIPNCDMHYGDGGTVPTDLAPALRNQAPGLSMSVDACRNLGGTTTFAATGTTTAVLFVNPETNPDYEILVTGLTGYSIVGKSGRGFSVSMPSAPGVVPFDWMIFRPQAAGVDPVTFPTIASPVLWIDPQYGVSLSSVSSVAPDNNPDHLRPTIHSITDRAAGIVFTTTSGKNDTFRIDRDDQPATASRQPNGWPFLYTFSETNPGMLSAPATALLTTDAYTYVLVSSIPSPDVATVGAVAQTVPTNGLGIVYNATGVGTRMLAYFGVANFVDPVADAVAGKWELIEVSKTSGQPPVYKVNGVTRTLSGSPPSTFTPNTVLQVGSDGANWAVAFCALWASDVSASMGPLRAALNTKYKLF